MRKVRVLDVAIPFLVGVSTWWLWMPSVDSIEFGVSVLGLCLILFRQNQYSFAVIWSIAFLLGNLHLSNRGPESVKVFEENAYTIGRVQYSGYQQAIVENGLERWRIQFYPEAPSLGEVVAVWHIPHRTSISWEGGVQFERRVLAERAPLRKAKAWVVLQERQAIQPAESFSWLKHGGVLWALISGDKSQIDPVIKERMRQTGTSHLLAISGMHIGLIAAFGYACIRWTLGWLVLFQRLDAWDVGVWTHRLGLLVSMAVAFMYGAQVGWPASAERAVWMVWIFCVGKLLERSFSLWDVLGLTALIMVYKEPALLHDLGFQLSFSAVIGIGLIGKRTQEWIAKLPNSTPIVFKWNLVSVAVTLGAMLGTFPICAWAFQEVAWVGLLANLIAGPLMATIAVPTTMVGMLFWEGGLVNLSMFCLAFADASIELSVNALDCLQFPTLKVAFDYWDVLYFILLVGVWLQWKSLWIRGVVGLTVLVLIVEGTPWRFGFASETSFLHVTFLNVGQGDATLLEWADGEVWLVDGGPFSFELVPYLQRRGIWHLDQVWLSHPHADHMDGLFLVLEKMSVGHLVVGRGLEAEDAQTEFVKLWELAERQGIPMEIADEWAENTAVVERDVRVLHPHDWRVDSKDRCNEESVVMEVSAGETRILLTGDIEEDAEAWLMDKVRHVDVLKVPHHGSNSSSSVDFIEALMPSIAVISVGKENRFHHPHPSTMWTLRNSRVLRTDIHGQIDLYIHQREMIVEHRNHLE